MLFTNENAPVYPHDRLLNVILIRFLPSKLHPNHVTWLRFFLIPFVLWQVIAEQWNIAVPLFLFAAFTDALDGSMARIRRQITMWGTVADPTADKLLIGSVAIVFVAREISPWFAAIIVALEILIVFFNVARRAKQGIVSANWAGKTKMLCQVAGVAFLLIDRLLHTPVLTPYAMGILAVSMILAVISLFTYSL